MTKRVSLDLARSMRTRLRGSEERAAQPTRMLAMAGVVSLFAAGMLLSARSHAPARIAPPSTSVTPEQSLQPTTGGVFVHVAGAVRKPGLYELGPEARVADAIEAAGGALPKAWVDSVNLAQVLTDGMKIEVPLAGEQPAPMGGTTDSAAGTALVSINSAGLEELETLPGVGPVTAQAIITHREEAGPFASLEGLLEVSGIGPATFAEIRPHVTL